MTNVEINVGVPRDLLARFDQVVKGRYASRAEAIRDLMRGAVEGSQHPMSRRGTPT